MIKEMRKTSYVVVGVCVLLLAACGGSEKVLTEQEYVEQAKESLDEGKYNDAVIQLKNAVKVNPNSAEGRYLLGELYVNVGIGAAAEKELQRAKELGVASEAITLLLGDALLQQGKADEVISSYQLNESDTVNEKLGKSIAVAEAYIQKGNIVAAKEWLGKAGQMSPDNGRVKLGVAVVAIAEGNFPEAQRLIDSVINVNGEQKQRAWLTLADLKRAEGNPEESVAAYKQASELSRSNEDYFYQVAMLRVISGYLGLNNPEKAETELNILKKSYSGEQLPDSVEINSIRANLAYQQKKYDVASEFAEKVLKIDENHLGALLLMGATTAIRGQPEQAEVYLTKFLTRAPNNVMARKLLAYVQMSRGHSIEAVDTLSPVVKSTKPDPELLSLIAGASLRAGEPKKSVEYYQQALELNKENAALRMGLAESYAGMGEFQRAIDELNKVKGEKGQYFAAELAIAETRIKEKNYSAALQSLGALEQNDPANPLPISLQGTVYALMTDESRAKVEFERALKLKPGYGPAARSLALMAIRGGNKETARKIYESALKDSPKELATYYDYIQFEMASGQFKHAEEMLKRVQSLDGDKTQSSVMLARLYLLQNNPSGALSELRSLGDTRRAPVLIEMGNAQMMLKEYINAKDSYKKAVEAENRSARSYYLLYTAHRALGEVDAAKAALVNALKQDGKFLPALVASANMALLSNELQKAKAEIKRIEVLAPGGEGLYVLKADLAMRERDYKQAVSMYEQAFKLGSNVDTAYKLAQAYWSNGEKERSVSLLKEVVGKYPEHLKLQYALASAYQNMGDTAGAIKQYESILARDGRNVSALNNIAWLLKDKDGRKAKEYAEKALTIEPDNEMLKDTLASINKLERK